jgi:hypothetical protein
MYWIVGLVLLALVVVAGIVCVAVRVRQRMDDIEGRMLSVGIINIDLAQASSFDGRARRQADKAMQVLLKHIHRSASQFREHIMSSSSGSMSSSMALDTSRVALFATICATQSSLYGASAFRDELLAFLYFILNYSPPDNPLRRYLWSRLDLDDPRRRGECGHIFRASAGRLRGHYKLDQGWQEWEVD